MRGHERNTSTVLLRGACARRLPPVCRPATPWAHPSQYLIPFIWHHDGSIIKVASCALDDRISNVAKGWRNDFHHSYACDGHCQLCEVCLICTTMRSLFLLPSGSVRAVPQWMRKCDLVTRLLSQTFREPVWTTNKHKIKEGVKPRVTVRRWQPCFVLGVTGSNSRLPIQACLVPTSHHPLIRLYTAHAGGISLLACRAAVQQYPDLKETKRSLQRQKTIMQASSIRSTASLFILYLQDPF
jgi:hypothetical protein